MKPVSHPWRQSWYFCNCEGLHTKGRLGRCCICLLLRFVVQCCFACGAWPSTAGVWSECDAFVSRKFLLKSLDAFPRNFAPAKISRYTVPRHCPVINRIGHDHCPVISYDQVDIKITSPTATEKVSILIYIATAPTIDTIALFLFIVLTNWKTKVLKGTAHL